MQISNKDTVLTALETKKGSFISGGMLADTLGVSRNAVWKAVRSLIDAGYTIESVTGKGYRLKSDCNILSRASIERFVHDERINVEYHASIDSTNTHAKARAEAGAAEGTLIVADEQTAGRGRQGRPFYSPAGTGVYFSLILRPAFVLEDVAFITSYAAVIVAQAIDELYGVHTQIKWVNDIFLDGHKVCGILTEASFDAETRELAYAVVGIGINTMRPQGGFPADARTVADAVCEDDADNDDLRAQLVARIADTFMAEYASIPARAHLETYRSRSLLDGRRVHVESAHEDFMATVLGINDDFTLHVHLDDGTTRDLVHGEVHIPSSQL